MVIRSEVGRSWGFSTPLATTEGTLGEQWLPMSDYRSFSVCALGIGKGNEV